MMSLVNVTSMEWPYLMGVSHNYVCILNFQNIHYGINWFTIMGWTDTKSRDELIGKDKKSRL